MQESDFKEQSSKEKKRAKTAAQRKIETYSGRRNPFGGDVTTTPRTIDVVDFAEARAFEINALNDALERANQARNSKAAQLLPRHLRRRTASHNVKRLPVRLRKKAIEEMESYNTTPKKQNRRKKRKSALRNEYMRRQGTKKWLETHIWHTKRMKMVELWGYKLAEHPNEKSIRSSYRASEHITIIHDVSYFEWIKLSGDQNTLINLMNCMTDPTIASVGSERYLGGKRQCATYLYEYLKYPIHLISPINLLWDQDNRNILIWIHPSAFNDAFLAFNHAIEIMDLKNISIQDYSGNLLMFEFTGPRTTDLLQAVLDVSDDNNVKDNDKEKANDKGDENNNNIDVKDNDNNDIKDNKDTKNGKVHINIDAHKTWKTLKNLQSSTTLPPGIVLGLTVLDPRLRFPQKVPPRKNTMSKDSENSLQEILTAWPNNVASSDLWNNDLIEILRSTKISDGELNNRRSKLLVPGQKLLKTSNDSVIPILLIQRDGLFAKYNKSEYRGGWSIVIPAGWGMDFWKSFIFAGAWVGGLRERHTNHFESGLPCFPYDYPGTKSFNDYTSKITRNELEKEYYKRPPAKRVNYKKLKVDSPFEPAFNKLLSIDNNFETDLEMSEIGKTEEEKGKLINIEKIVEADNAIEMIKETKTGIIEDVRMGDTQDATDNDEEIDEDNKEQRSWLLMGDKNIQLLEIFNNNNSGQQSFIESEFKSSLVSFITRSFKNRGITFDDSNNLESILESKLESNLELKLESIIESKLEPRIDLTKALVKVRIKLLANGIPKYNAIIYRIKNKQLYEKWKNELRNRKRKYKEFDDDDNDGGGGDDGDNDCDLEADVKQKLKELPPTSDIIGYVTTGQFSFSQGHGVGIGCCSLTGILDSFKSEKTEKSNIKNFVLIRNVTSLVCKPASLEFLS